MHQRLRRLRKRVRDAVAEALTQTGPILDGLGLTAAVPHNLRDVLRLTPGAFIREKSQPVNGRGSRENQERKQKADQKLDHHRHLEQEESQGEFHTVLPKARNPSRAPYQAAKQGPQ